MKSIIIVLACALCAGIADAFVTIPLVKLAVIFFFGEIAGGAIYARLPK